MRIKKGFAAVKENNLLDIEYLQANKNRRI